jgi:hypothetical protein
MYLPFIELRWRPRAMINPRRLLVQSKWCKTKKRKKVNLAGYACNINVPTLLEIRVLQGFFTNTYNKPYPMGFFTLCKKPSRCEKPFRFFYKAWKPYRVGFVIRVGKKNLNNPYFYESTLRGRSASMQCVVVQEWANLMANSVNNIVPPFSEIGLLATVWTCSVFVCLIQIVVNRSFQGNETTEKDKKKMRFLSIS